MKMHSLWEYFITAFPESQRGLKKIKKAKSMEAYDDAVAWILEGEMESSWV